MSTKIYSIRVNVWRYPGMAGWHFVSVPQKESKEIKDKQKGKPRKGWGSVPVIVTLGKSTWATSIFPDKKSGSYLLPLKAEVRKKEKIKEGDTLSMKLAIK